MKKFEEYFNTMVACSLGGASIGSFIDKFDGAWMGAIVGAVIGFMLVFHSRRKKKKQTT